MVVEVNARAATLEAGVPRKLFGPIPGVGESNYAVSADGQRILAYSSPQASARVPLTVVKNWAADLKK